MKEGSIRTPDQRLRVFVSSTLAELAEERAAVREAIERLQLSPVMFELGARPHPPRELYRAYLEQSHIFVGIYWQRYGWVAPGETVSGLEDEYRLSQGMPQLLYVKAPAQEREPQLDELLRRIQSDDTASYKPFRTAEELAQLVASDLALLLSERFVTLRAPTGVVTLLFAEIRGNDAASMFGKRAEAVRGIITSKGGYLYSTADGIFRAAFAQPVEAVTAVSELQSALTAALSGDSAPPIVRAALHSGVAEFGGDGYFGPAVLRAAKMLGLANDGQVLVSEAVVELLDREIAPPLELRSLGSHRIYDAGPAEEIHQLVIPGMPSEFPPMATSAASQSNLPIQLTTFVGRRRELTEVKAALGDSRLVTLTGVGGAGKSRLALSAASEVADAFADGAHLIQLAPLKQPDQIPSAIAAGLGLPGDPRRPLIETLKAQLRSRRTLILMDNCEHLLPSCAELIADMLQTSSSLRVLATSREALAVPGEVILPVPPLEVPPKGTDSVQLGEFSAVQLFTDRARAVRPGFMITEANAPALTEIVTRLDGIPLALELAAARVRLLSVEQIADRLSDRFRLLSGGARTVLPRQQTLRGAIDWSYELLDETERAVLRRLAVFAGSWTVEAADTVCSGSGVQADILDVLGRLVDKSLAVVLEGAEENRFGLLETVRQYAAERLLEAGETDQTSAAHRDWCCALVETAAAHLGGADQVRWLQLLEAERDNISAALAWSISGNDPNSGLRIAIGAAWFWYLRGHWDEATKWFTRSLAFDGADRTLRARGEAWAALFHWRREQIDAARQLATGSLARLDGTAYNEVGLCHLVLTLIAISEQDLGAADTYGRKALEVFRQQGHAWGITTALLILTRIAIYRESPDSDALLTESAALLDSRPDRWGKVQALNLQGYEAFRNLDLDHAHDLYTASHALAVELGDTAAQAENLLALGHVHLLRAETEEAARVLEQNRRLLEQLQDHHQLGHTDQALALVAIAKGQVAEGEALFREVTSRFREMGLTGMGGSDALFTADLYRRAGRPTLAGALLRHALTLIDPNQQPDEYARAQQGLAALTPLQE